MPWILLLALGGAAALAMRKKSGGGGPVNASPLVNGKQYHMIVRTELDNREAENAAKLGVLSAAFGLDIAGSLEGDAADPFVWRYVATWIGQTGAFIGDSPAFRIVAITPLEG